MGAFQLKDFNSIVLSEINHARSVTNKITDFLPGSVVRTVMEAPAVEIEELYLRMFLGLRDAIPVATFQSFGFDRLPAMTAIGYLTIVYGDIVTPLVVPVGTVFRSADGRTYRSIDAVTLAPLAGSARLRVAFGSAGVAGNIAAGAITESPFFNSSIFTIANATISTGRDIETDSEREARFAAYIGALSRGTVSAVLFAVKQARILDSSGNVYEYVLRAGIAEVPGRVSLYLYSNAGSPSLDLLENGQTIIDGTRDALTGVITPGYRPAGVRVDVLPMVERAVPLSIRVRMFSGFPLSSGVLLQLSNIFSDVIRAVPPGATLYLGTLVEAMLAATGVEEIVPVTTSNFQCLASEALTPGALTVVEL